MTRMLYGIVAGAALFFLACCPSSVFHSIKSALVDALHELVLSVRV